MLPFHIYITGYYMHRWTQKLWEDSSFHKIMCFTKHTLKKNVNISTKSTKSHPHFQERKLQIRMWSEAKSMQDVSHLVPAVLYKCSVLPLMFNRKPCWCYVADMPQKTMQIKAMKRWLTSFITGRCSSKCGHTVAAVNRLILKKFVKM